MSNDIDDFDLGILRQLQSNSQISFEAIGEQIGLSTASVHRRIKRLREKQYIKKEVAVIDAKSLGIAMTMIVHIEMERERADLLASFRQSLRAFPEVQQCYYVTGNFDFMLIVKVKDLEHYDQFTQTAFFDNPNIKKFSTSVVMSDVKVGLELPI